MRFEHLIGALPDLQHVAILATFVAEMKTTAATDLGMLLFGSYRRQVLGLLLMHPDESFHLREIARVTHTQPGTLRRELTQLADAGVLARERVGNLVRYRANASCPIYDELRGILRKTAGAADVLRDALTGLSGKIVVAFVYGSIASGKERRSSDIDVMVVGTATFEEVVAALLPCQEQLRREINPSVYGPGEFKKKAKEKGSFLQRVLREPKIFLLGTAHDLRKLGADRKTKAV